MKRLVIASVLFIAFVSPAHAGFDEGREAEVRGDYETALQEYRDSAEQGDDSSQIGLGAMYANGHGVLQDYVRAHMWFDIAAAKGNKLGRRARDLAADLMTPAQIAEAQKLAREWMEKHGE